MQTIEAFAHTLRGIAIAVFVFWSITIFPMRRRSRMMWLCFVLSLGMAVCFTKDIIFVFPAINSSIFYCDLVSLVDLMCVPLACSFFYEAVKPRGAKIWRIVGLELIQAAFIVAYIVHPSHNILLYAFGIAFFLTLLTLMAVVLFAVRFRRYIANNYSYTETIAVGWVIVVTVVYALLYFLCYVALDSMSWWSEIIFNVCSIVLWTVAFVFSLRHRVVEDFADEETPAVPASSMPHPAPTPRAVPASSEPASYGFGEGSNEEKALIKAMEQDRLYLNPKLTLIDLATEIGTNKTYLSQYLREVKHLTFYDYINNYRSEAACRLIREMAESGTRVNMAEIAAESGFNSTSTFYRAFAKFKGCAPALFYAHEMEKNGGG